MCPRSGESTPWVKRPTHASRLSQRRVAGNSVKQVGQVVGLAVGLGFFADDLLLIALAAEPFFSRASAASACRRS